jgi:hypothetical protein
MAIYTPIIKKKGFDPSPVARFGIPDYANSAINPTVEGTLAHEEFWKEEMDRILHGYKTGGIFIPGRYYYYLNYILISTPIRGRHYPEFVDIDLEYFTFIDDCKKNNKGIMCIKARRKGMSEKSKAIVDYGSRFSPSGYKAGICAGQEVYSLGLFNKVKNVNKDLPKELQVHYLKDNDKELVCGYTEMTSTGQVNGGSMNTIVCETMYDNPDIFKGNAFEDVIFEEAGQFKHLIAGYNATKACFMVGTKMVGTPYVYGTGGDIKGSSQDFRDMWTECDNYGLAKFEFMGPRMMIGFFSGSKNERGHADEKVPNIKKLKTSNSVDITGCEDVEEAERVIIETRKELIKGRNKKKYYDYLQDYPLNDKEAFLTFSNNNFDSTILSGQGYAIDSSPTRTYLRYKLDYEVDDQKNIKIPFQIKATLALEEEPEDNVILVRPGYAPIKGYRNLYTSGLDSYDQDKSQTSKSLGSMVVLMRDHMISGLDSMTPCAIIRSRPKHKEMFYELCLKLSIWYDLTANVMIDLGAALIMQYFKEKGCQKYLAKRPASFESEDSQQQHEFGFKFTGYSKPRMIALLQSYIAYHGQKIWFQPLIEDLLNYDVQAKDSDWDAADALGLALIRHTEINKKPVDVTKALESDPYELTQFTREGGELRPIVNKQKLADIKDPFLRLVAMGKV